MQQKIFTKPNDLMSLLQFEIDRLTSLLNQVYFLKRICVFGWLIDQIYQRIFSSVTALSKLCNQLSDN